MVLKPDRTDRSDQELATSSVLKKPPKSVKNQVEPKTEGKNGFALGPVFKTILKSQNTRECQLSLK